MTPAPLGLVALRRALAVRDLTDPGSGPHALQLLVDAITTALERQWGCPLRLHRGAPIVSIADNYDRLHYPAAGAARDARYSRYVCDTALLRTQTTAHIPGLLSSLAEDPPTEVLIACPGLVYRRDSIDRLHAGEPHQLDLWRIAHSRSHGHDRDRDLGEAELEEMIATVLAAALPGRAWRTTPAVHPYTCAGREIEVADGGTWIEVGECGLALPALLSECGLPAPAWSGLAMGLGLDRLLMLRKGIDDIRLLRAENPRVASQLQDLAAYRPVSAMPAAVRDLSIAIDRRTPSDDESLGDAVRSALQERAGLVERVVVLSTTPYQELPQQARERLGMSVEEQNVLVRISLRALDRTLTAGECNQLRDEIYAALHRGTAWQWAAR